MIIFEFDGIEKARKNEADSARRSVTDLSEKMIAGGVDDMYRSLRDYEDSMRCGRLAPSAIAAIPSMLRRCGRCQLKACDGPSRAIRAKSVAIAIVGRRSGALEQKALH